MLANHQVFVFCDFVDYDVEGAGSTEVVCFFVFFVSFFTAMFFSSILFFGDDDYEVEEGAKKNGQRSQVKEV